MVEPLAAAALAKAQAALFAANPPPVLISVTGEKWFDELGKMIPIDSAAINLVPYTKDVAASRFIIGSAIPPYRYTDPTDAANYVPGILEEHALLADVFTFSGETLPNSLQATQGAWNLVPWQTQIARTEALGKKWRFHPLFYPAHDFPWANSGTVTSATYKSLIDAHINNVLPLCNVASCQDIVVTNEIFDGNTTANGGYLTNVWKTASAVGTVASSAPGPGTFDGPDWVAYAFLQAKAKSPTKSLFYGQDQLEQLYDGFHSNLATNVLNFFTKALGAGIPVDGLMMQGHLKLDFALQPVPLKNFLTSLKALGMKLTIGEFDVRTATGNFASYTQSDLDTKSADLVRRFLDIVLPFVDVGQPVMSWMVSDKYTTWLRGERTTLLDANYQPKPLYAAFRDTVATTIRKGL